MRAKLEGRRARALKKGANFSQGVRLIFTEFSQKQRSHRPRRFGCAMKFDVAAGLGMMPRGDV
jgi:hypothetical protein